MAEIATGIAVIGPVSHCYAADPAAGLRGQAYFAEAMAFDQFKREQNRIAREIDLAHVEIKRAEPTDSPSGHQLETALAIIRAAGEGYSRGGALRQTPMESPPHGADRDQGRPGRPSRTEGAVRRPFLVGRFK